jgi:hypothetical protein
MAMVWWTSGTARGSPLALCPPQFSLTRPRPGAVLPVRTCPGNCAVTPGDATRPGERPMGCQPQGTRRAKGAAPSSYSNQ